MSTSAYPTELDNLNSATSDRNEPNLTSVLNNIQSTIGTTGDFNFDVSGTADMAVGPSSAPVPRVLRLTWPRRAS